MTITEANDNNVFHLDDVFAKHASSRVLAPVVQRPLEGVSRDGGRLPTHGVLGNYAAVDGKPHFLGAVSDSYKVAQMRDLCFDAEQKMRQAFDARTLNSVEVHDRIANGGAFVSREYRVMDLAEELREVRMRLQQGELLVAVGFVDDIAQRPVQTGNGVVIAGQPVGKHFLGDPGRMFVNPAKGFHEGLAVHAASC